MSNVSNAAAAAGRFLMSAVFLIAGFQKLSGFFGTVAYMASMGLPLPMVVAISAIVIECLGGLLLLVGYQTRVVGLVLAGWSIATALVAHANFGDPDQTIHFLKNFAMAGGFLQIVAFGAGALSVDYRRKSGEPQSSPTVVS